ncbi:MAG TPA: alpha/beta hydrolase [Casimicrobiaceae bacterium]|nr:alpha/beta hydrolase [Casimicrobiaceae bacterium]
MELLVDGCRVHLYTGTRAFSPQQPTVVFVHGAAHDHSVFALQSRYFAWHGRNVLAVDLPGHGRSGGEALSSVEAIADWLAALAAAAGVERAAWVGHSMGSLAVLECAARHPRCVERIALLGPAVPMAVNEELLAAAGDDEATAFAMIIAWSFNPVNALAANPSPGMWMTGNALRLLQRSRPGTLATDLRACNDYAQGLEAARACRAPALLVLGERDQMAPAKATPPLVAALAGARVVTLADTGHAMMQEAPDALLDALKAFLPAP